MPRETRSKLYALIDETSTSHKPINITGKRRNAVLLSEDDRNAINETLHLLSIPCMHESIREGKDVEFDQRSDWERLALTY